MRTGKRYMLQKIPFSHSESVNSYTIVCLFLLPLIIQWISSTVVLCLKENVALMVWGEVFSISGLLKLLMGVESKWFNAQFRGMASRKPLCLNNKRGIVLTALQRCSRAAECSSLCKLSVGF